MARQKPSDAIAALEKQQKDLAEKLKEARKKAKAETAEIERRKRELWGAAALAEAEASPHGAATSALRRRLETLLKSASDRELVGLPPLPKVEKEKPAEPTPAPFLMAGGGVTGVGGG